MEFMKKLNIENPNINIKYQYGNDEDGNSAGRLIYHEDATGIQQFKYGKLGELTENIRTFVLPDQQIYSFGMKWNYDTWNRIKNITYADGEEVNYEYDKAGMLVEMQGIKGADTYNYLIEQGYDKFGNKIMMKYGNDITTYYEYDPNRRRLSNLFALDLYGDTVQSVVYHYDSGDNITAVEKSAERGVNGMSYSVNLTYQYDDLNRLTHSEGLMNHFKTHDFIMDFEYSASGNIIQKQLTANVLEVNCNKNIEYNNTYFYDQSKPHAVASINYGDKSFEWSANGNMKMDYDQNTLDLRLMHWDEENRLTTLHDQGKTLNYYTYDASGERTLKLSGNMEVMDINGQFNVNVYNISNYTLYTSSFMVINPYLYTKHYYIESDRIVSKIGGGMENLNYNIYNHVYAFDIQNVNDYENKALSNDTMMYRHIDSVNVSDEVLMSADFKRIGTLRNYNDTENDIYFYHKDHIGSSTQITDKDAVVIHHIEYMPSGEQPAMSADKFAEQRSSWGTSYKFNSKELDQETGLYYYGARYYSPWGNIWLSVDPMSDKYPSMSPYMYCAGNPVILVDPDGREIEITEILNKDGTTTVNIKFTAALINNSSKKISKGKMQEYSRNMESSLREYYGGNYDGNVQVNIDADIRVVNNIGEVNSNDHVISIVDKTSSKEAGSVGYAENLGRNMQISKDILDKKPETVNPKMRDTGLTNMGGPTLKRTFGHEFGHFCGLFDNPGYDRNLLNQSDKPNAGVGITSGQINQIRGNKNNVYSIRNLGNKFSPIKY